MYTIQKAIHHLSFALLSALTTPHLAPHPLSVLNYSVFPKHVLKPSSPHTSLFQEGLPSPSLSTSLPLSWLTPAYLSKSNLGVTSIEKACQTTPISGEVDAFPLSSHSTSIYIHVTFFSRYSTVVYRHVCFSNINLKVGTRYHLSVSSQPMTMPEA